MLDHGGQILVAPDLQAFRRADRLAVRPLLFRQARRALVQLRDVGVVQAQPASTVFGFPLRTASQVSSNGTRFISLQATWQAWQPLQ